MNYLRVVIFLGVLWATSAARAQYGLYGSPELVRLPQVESSPSIPSDMTPSAPPRRIDAASYAVPLGRPLASASMVPSGGPVVQPPNTPLPSAPSSVSPLPPAPSPTDQSAPRARPSSPPAPSPSAPPDASPSLEPIPENQGLIRQMLEEADCYGSVPAALPGVPAATPFGEAVCAPGTECAPAPVCTLPKWYATARGLIMTRDKANRLWTTYETDNNINQIPTDPHWDWAGGGEIRFGRWFGVGCDAPADAYGLWGSCGSCAPAYSSGPWALEAAYWTLDDFSYTVSRSIAAGSVSTPLLVDEVTFGGVPGTQYFDSAAEHRVHHASEVHSLEVNVLVGQPFPSGGLLDLNWFVGARYFRFADELNFASLDLGWTWGAEGGIHEVYLRDRITNDLVGCHFGFNASYLLGFNLRLFLNPSLGIYGNHMKNEFQLYRGDGVVAVPTQPTGAYPVRSSKDNVAFLSQIDLGLDWQFSPNWSANVGYRVLFATGIGLSDHQIPAYIVDIPEIADIDDNGDLILHGAFAGLTLRF